MPRLDNSRKANKDIMSKTIDFQNLEPRASGSYSRYEREDEGNLSNRRQNIRLKKIDKSS